MKSKFNFLAPKGGREAAPVVRVRASGRDQFAGLRGHDYVRQRGLDIHLPRHGDDVPPSHPSWLLK